MQLNSLSVVSLRFTAAHRRLILNLMFFIDPVAILLIVGDFIFVVLVLLDKFSVLTDFYITNYYQY